MQINNHLFPNFLVVGAAKSGTSSLDQYFRQHPNIFMPDILKELNFFHLRGFEKERAILKRVPYMPTNLLSYLGFFYKKRKDQISGECSPSYLYYYDETICNIKELHPNWQELKIIIILREPIDKIWSHYKFVKMNKLDPANFNLDKSIELEGDRVKQTSLLPDLFYLDNTSYYHQVKAYLEVFKYVKIVKYDDLKNTPDTTMKDLFDFLDVDNNITIDTTKKHNRSVPIMNYRNKVYRRIATNLPLGLHKLVPQKCKEYLKIEEMMSEKVKLFLANHYSTEIESLETLTGIDFSDWRQKYNKILDDK
jgi:hypothetical protein